MPLQIYNFREIVFFYPKFTILYVTLNILQRAWFSYRFFIFFSPIIYCYIIYCLSTAVYKPTHVRRNTREQTWYLFSRQIVSPFIRIHCSSVYQWRGDFRFYRYSWYAYLTLGHIVDVIYRRHPRNRPRHRLKMLKVTKILKIENIFYWDENESRVKKKCSGCPSPPPKR